MRTRCQVHKYVKGKLGDKIIYKCSSCPSYVFFPMIIGRESLCFGCGKQFTIGLKNLQKYPHCGCLKERYKKKYKLKSFEKTETPAEGTSKSELLDLLMRKLG